VVFTSRHTLAQVTTALTEATAAYVRRDHVTNLELPFEAVPDLVARRLVPVRGGRCVLPAAWLDRLLSRLFARQLLADIGLAAAHLAYADERIYALAEQGLLAFQQLPRAVVTLDRDEPMTLEDIKEVRSNTPEALWAGDCAHRRQIPKLIWYDAALAVDVPAVHEPHSPRAYHQVPPSPLCAHPVYCLSKGTCPPGDR